MHVDVGHSYSHTGTSRIQYRHVRPSFQPQIDYVNKNVLRLSSYHSTFTVSGEDRKPSVILDYNANKVIVDIIMDEITENFNCLHTRVRWPMVINNYNMINIVCCNRYTI